MAEDAPATVAVASEEAPPLPVAAKDHPENIDTLLEVHREAIAQVRAACPEIKELPQYPFYDDIFFLRFMLSFKKVDKATEAVKKCYAWRQENAELLSHAPRTFADEETLNGPLGHLFRTMQKYQVAGIWDPSAVDDHGFVVVLRGAMGRPKALFSNLTYEENMNINFSFRECAYRYCDALTRQQRRLTKQSLFFDVVGMRFSDLIDPKQQKVYGKVSKISSYVYPQLIRKMCMVNSPKWMSIAMKVVRAVMPKSAMEKIEVFSSVPKLARSEWAQKCLNIDKMPDFLGGKVTKIPPELTGELIVAEGDDERVRLKVPPRSATNVQFPIPTENGVFEMIAWVEHYGINFEVYIESGEYDSAAAEAAVADESTTDVADEVSFYKLTGEKTVLKEHGKLRSEDGTTRLVCEGIGPGIVTVVWDNQHSMLRNKNVQYTCSIDVAAPAEEAIPEVTENAGGASKPAEE